MKTKTIQFFKEIASIPRESGNEENIAKYLCKFAKSRNLYYECDKYNNVLIKKKNCNKEPIILQAHTDMVCEKEEGKVFGFEKDGIEVIEENGYLRANGTTLGADNGIGIAQILSVLDSNIKCNIEAVFTVSEETSMIGAMNFDTTKLKGKKLLSLDGFEENCILIESACFYDIILKSNYCFNEKGKIYEIALTGMKGGHSGFDIDKGFGNSSIELAKIMDKIQDIKISNFIGGTKFNVIPSCAKAKFYSKLSLQEIKNICKKEVKTLQDKYPNIKIEVYDKKEEAKLLDNKQSREFLKTIIEFPEGVIHKNEKQEVTTSINIGIVDLEEQEMKIGMRSSKKGEEAKCVELIKEFSKKHKLEFTILGSQPGFESREDSDLIQKLLKTHPVEKFKSLPVIKAVHITVEVGFFKEKIPELQIAIIAPNIQGAHTPRECVEISSIERVDNWLWEFLKLGE